MARWPNITYGKIFLYFVESMAVDGNAVENLKSSEAYQDLHSNTVGCVLAYQHHSVVYLKAHVEPSQCLNKSCWRPEQETWRPLAAPVLLGDHGATRLLSCGRYGTLCIESNVPPSA